MRSGSVLSGHQIPPAGVSFAVMLWRALVAVLGPGCDGGRQQRLEPALANGRDRRRDAVPARDLDDGEPLPRAERGRIETGVHQRALRALGRRDHHGTSSCVTP